MYMYMYRWIALVDLLDILAQGPCQSLCSVQLSPDGALFT